MTCEDTLRVNSPEKAKNTEGIAYSFPFSLLCFHSSNLFNFNDCSDVKRDLMIVLKDATV